MVADPIFGFLYGDPCNVSAIMLDNFLVFNFIPNVDASEPKVRGRISLVENTFYINSRTEEKVYRYNFD